MRILVDAMPEKIDDCPYANCVPLSKPRTFICEMDPYMVECKGVYGCPVFMSYDEFKNRTYKQSSHKHIAKCNHFVEGVEKYHMTNPWKFSTGIATYIIRRTVIRNRELWQKQ